MEVEVEVGGGRWEVEVEVEVEVELTLSSWIPPKRLSSAVSCTSQAHGPWPLAYLRTAQTAAQAALHCTGLHASAAHVSLQAPFRGGAGVAAGRRRTTTRRRG